MEKAREKINNTLKVAKSVIFGQDEMLESILAALVCGGHLLIEGMPGLGKTFSVSTMSKLCDLSFSRIQFTPDLLPSDLIGTMIYNQQKEEFTTKFGPIFTQILLADEINRSPAKVQAALLEAMGEKQVTIGENTHKLSNPFVVLATQNPIDQEGTYPLPEAQLDRFMMKIEIKYPKMSEEIKILDLKKDPLKDLNNILSTDDLIGIQENINGIYIDEKIKKYIINVVNATRPSSDLFLKEFKGAVVAGASPRACIWLYVVGKYIAFMDGKDFVTPEHIMKIMPSILNHRIILSYEATIDNIKTRDIVTKVAQSLV